MSLPSYNISWQRLEESVNSHSPKADFFFNASRKVQPPNKIGLGAYNSIILLPLNSCQFLVGNFLEGVSQSLTTKACRSPVNEAPNYR